MEYNLTWSGASTQQHTIYVAYSLCYIFKQALGFFAGLQSALKCPFYVSLKQALPCLQVSHCPSAGVPARVTQLAAQLRHELTKEQESRLQMHALAVRLAGATPDWVKDQQVRPSCTLA